MLRTNRDAQRERRLDEMLEDSFPASDPPANTGIVGVGSNDHRAAPHERNMAERPIGTPTSDRHAMETAHLWENETESPPPTPHR